jgi:hypothetical protein
MLSFLFALISVALSVPCLTSYHNPGTGECFILNNCSVVVKGIGMCDHDVSQCGRAQGTTTGGMCARTGNFSIGICQKVCQALTWDKIDDATGCVEHGKCCTPRTDC